MGGQVLHHTHVGDAGWERALPPSGDLVHLPELARLQLAAQALQGGVVALDMADRTDQSTHLERLDQPRCRGQVGRQRLLNEGR